MDRAKRSTFVWGAIIALASISIACTLSAGQLNPPAGNSQDQSPMDEDSGVQSDLLLPHSLYFLSAMGLDTYQIWRLERDGSTLSQITFEAAGVDDFAVSPASGNAAYTTANQLVLTAADGSSRKVLLDGGPVDEASENYHYRGKINGLAWSPDGSLLAYGRDGLNFYSPDDDTHYKITTNQIEASSDGALVPRELYFPGVFSPSGTHLLVNVNYLEGGSLAVLEISTGKMIPLGKGIVCCYPAWTQDSNAILVGSASIGMVDPGLWIYNAASGRRKEILPPISPEGTYNFVSYPYQLPSGDLVYLYGSSAIYPDQPVPLSLVRSAGDGISGRTQLRPESLDIYELIWGPSGRMMAAVQAPLGEPGWPLSGPVILIDIEGNPIRPLATSGYHIQWGP